MDLFFSFFLSLISFVRSLAVSWWTMMNDRRRASDDDDNYICAGNWRIGMYLFSFRAFVYVYACVFSFGIIIADGPWRVFLLCTRQCLLLLASCRCCHCLTGVVGVPSPPTLPTPLFACSLCSLARNPISHSSIIGFLCLLFFFLSFDYLNLSVLFPRAARAGQAWFLLIECLFYSSPFFRWWRAARSTRQIGTPNGRATKQGIRNVLYAEPRTGTHWNTRKWAV
jgi:hypothetical protein